MNVVSKKELKSPPLNEAIFEVRWNNQKVDPLLQKDSKLLTGMYFEKLKDEYKFHEPLEVSKMPVPAELLQGVVQHRFRVAKDEWPLVQIGSGVVTVNTTTNYTWVDFKKRSLAAVENLFSIYPVANAVNFVNLRYLNTFPFDFKKQNALDFLKNDLSLGISIPADVLKAAEVSEMPNNFNLRFIYPSESPDGELTVTFVSGKDGKKTDVIAWEIGFKSKEGDFKDISKDLDGWLDKTHTKIETVFFSLGEKILQ